MHSLMASLRMAAMFSDVTSRPSSCRMSAAYTQATSEPMILVRVGTVFGYLWMGRRGTESVS